MSEKQHLQSQIDKIIQVKELLLDLHKDDVLSFETIGIYYTLLDKKFDEIYSQLNNQK